MENLQAIRWLRIFRLGKWKRSKRLNSHDVFQKRSRLPTAIPKRTPHSLRYYGSVICRIRSQQCSANVLNKFDVKRDPSTPNAHRPNFPRHYETFRPHRRLHLILFAIILILTSRLCGEKKIWLRFKLVYFFLFFDGSLLLAMCVGSAIN